MPIDFSLTDEQRQLRDAVRTFITREVLPLEETVLRRERAGQDAFEPGQLHDLQLKGKKSGFWGLLTPEEYGGMGLDAVTAATLFAENARTFVPFRFGGNADVILFMADEDQKRRYLIPTIEGTRQSCFALTEPDAGSDAKRIRTRAVRDRGDWVINGEKIFITRGHTADFAIVFAVTDPEADATHGGVTCFLVDRDMGWTSHPIDTMAEMGTAALSFDNVRVPSANVLGEVGHGFRLAMEWIRRGRWTIPARAVGAAERLLQMAIDQANLRRTFGKPLADRQAIQWMIADSHVEIESTKWLTLFAAWQEDQGLDARHACSVAKLHGATMANRVVDRVLQIHGGMGYSKELPIERWYRELRVLRIYEGTDEIQRRAIAQDLLGGTTRLAGLGAVANVGW